jgi:hypothetical protein
MITESDELSDCLNKAALLFPNTSSRTELLRLVIEEGSKSISQQAENRMSERLKALERLRKISTGMWPADWNEQRKAEWPD